MHEVTVTISLSPSDQAVLRRYLADINAIIEQDNARVAELGPASPIANWAESDEIGALFGSALDRERRLQQVRDGRQENPDWITQLVRDIRAELAELKVSA